MSVKKKEAKQLQYADEFRISTGISFQSMDYKEVSPSERFFICVFRGLLIYMGLLGLTGLVITSLELPCNQFVIYLVEFVISMVVALLYYHKWLFNIGYIGFFIIFCFIAFYFMVYANSGFNAIMNRMMSLIDQKLNLDGYREYTETIKNSYVTITICIILLSFLGVCFLNSSISSYMSPTYLALQLFPLMQICFYLDKDVNYFYVALIVACWLSVYLIKRSYRYRNVLSSKKELAFQSDGIHFKYRNDNIKNTIYYNTILGCVLSAVILGASFGVTKIMPLSWRDNNSPMKAGTDRVMGEFAMNGLLGFFNTMQATGGMSGGKLGGVRQVYMDFETDLMVAYVPYSTEPVYLKGYVGEEYTGSEWIQIKSYRELSDFPYYLSDFSKLVNKESSVLKHVFETGEAFSGKGKMQITNVDADTGYYYVPYYADINPSNMVYRKGEVDLFKGDIIVSGTPIGQIYTVNYFPLIKQDIWGDYQDEAESIYRNYVYDYYLMIPNSIRDDLKEICEEWNLHGDADEIIDQIKSKFYEEYLYSLNPGKTPNKRDFVLYFLKKQKRGYCAHFATSGAMLLRAMGIPARYVEGYCFSPDSFSDVEVLEGEDAEDWYQGYSYLREESSEDKVLSVDVTDASAHAWVEIYKDGFGWVPVEFTIARQEPERGGSDFWSQFSDFFGVNSDENGSPIQLFTSNIKKSTPIILLSVLIAMGGIVMVWYIRRLVRMYHLYYRKDKYRLVKQYQTITRLLKRYRFSEKNNIFHDQMQLILVETLEMSEENIIQYRRNIEQASFGNEEFDLETIQWSTQQFKQFIAEVKKKVSKGARIYLSLKY